MIHKIEYHDAKCMATCTCGKTFKLSEYQDGEDESHARLANLEEIAIRAKAITEEFEPHNSSSKENREQILSLCKEVGI